MNIFWFISSLSSAFVPRRVFTHLYNNRLLQYSVKTLNVCTMNLESHCVTGYRPRYNSYWKLFKQTSIICVIDAPIWFLAVSEAGCTGYSFSLRSWQATIILLLFNIFVEIHMLIIYSSEKSLFLPKFTHFA